MSPNPGSSRSSTNSSRVSGVTFSSSSLFLLATAAFSAVSTSVFAQAGKSTIFETYSSEILIGLLVTALLLVLMVVFILTDRLLRITEERVHEEITEGKPQKSRQQEKKASERRSGQATGGEQKKIEPKHSAFLSAEESSPKKTPPQTNGQGNSSEVIKLKKGMNINLQGNAKRVTDRNLNSKTYAVRPIDFKGISPIPKLMIETGQEVKAGDPLFYDKGAPDILYTAPVSGEVIEIRRGEKRAIHEVVILADKDIQFKEFPSQEPSSLSREQIIKKMTESGLWPFLIQRPFGVIADTNQTPRDIFISGFDTSPLAPDYNYVMQGLDKEFQAGIDALAKLTDGSVHLGLNAEKKLIDAFGHAENVKRHYFRGPHPTGNPGVQIHHINPINKGEIVWQVNPQHVAIIGRFFREGRFDTKKLIALVGAEVEEPKYFETYMGACIKNMVADNLTNDHVRYVSGNPLTGHSIHNQNHIGCFHDQVSVILEGDQPEFMGWLLPSYPRPSHSRTFPWSFIPSQKFRTNTNTHGEERAFVVTGQYESILPMDIYPQHLLKSILFRDFDQIEGLGIYEVLEEDFALCEFVCTSKTPVQKILRDGMNYVIEQS